MNETGIKGKIEQKYWKTKQKAIEKLGKDQDEFVIAGDSEVDSRLEVIYGVLSFLLLFSVFTFSVLFFLKKG